MFIEESFTDLIPDVIPDLNPINEAIWPIELEQVRRAR